MTLRECTYSNVNNVQLLLYNRKPKLAFLERRLRSGDKNNALGRAVLPFQQLDATQHNALMSIDDLNPDLHTLELRLGRKQSLRFHVAPLFPLLFASLSFRCDHLRAQIRISLRRSPVCRSLACLLARLRQARAC